MRRLETAFKVADSEESSSSESEVEADDADDISVVEVESSPVKYRGKLLTGKTYLMK